MRLPVLQIWEPTAMPPEWVVSFVQTTDVLSAIIGLFIAYQAYRGYRRNQSRPMLFISIGFVLSLAVPFVLLLVYLVVPDTPEIVLTILSQTCQVLGLGAILYALRMPT